MKLRNKKTGEIKDACEVLDMKEDGVLYKYYSLAELNKDWEDVPEEPKEHYFITECGEVYPTIEYDNEDTKLSKQIGNYFETKEEAEKAVEKLKAFKRLQDLGFRFDGIRFRDKYNYIEWKIEANNELTDDEIKEFREGLHKVFGSKDESKGARIICRNRCL